MKKIALWVVDSLYALLGIYVFVARIYLIGGAVYVFFDSVKNKESNLSIIQQRVLDFDQEMIIQEDGTVDVSERITYDFGEDKRHGIYRFIPRIKEDDRGQKYQLGFTLLSVTDENGKEYEYKNENNYEFFKLKIGDPYVFLQGTHVYDIKYRVSGALTYFDAYDELFWNVTGDRWDVPIEKAQSTLYLPDTMQEKELQSACYRGAYGSSEKCKWEYRAPNIIHFETSDLAEQEGMSVAVGIPKGVVTRLDPERYVEFEDTLQGKITIPILITLALGWYVFLPLWIPFLWWRNGRDEGGKGSSHGIGAGGEGSVRAWFDPPKIDGRVLTPAETGVLLDERANIRELTALIVHLAQRKYLKIVEGEKKSFELVRLDRSSLDGDLLPYEKRFLTGIFQGKKSVHLKSGSMTDAATSAVDDIYAQSIKNGYISKHPEKTRENYRLLIGIAVVTANIPLAISAAIFGPIMPRKTRKGVEATHVARSLKNFLSSQDRQLSFQAEHNMMFEKLLPYAIAFGVENLWTARFQDLKYTDLAWYEGDLKNSNRLTRNFSSMQHSFSSSFMKATKPGTFSSGTLGGFSGGGGGGGGGGSW